ncbi:MAG: hypothetical protein JWM39_99 [Parcubacteria group bacterium]|nr:hypothetical protein [Parcubacteria group bacterium]
MNLSNTKMIIAGLLGALCFASAASASATTLKDRAWYTQEGAAKPVLFSIMPPDKAQEGDHAFRACQYYAEDTHQKWHSCGYFREPGVPKASDEMPQPQSDLQFHASDSAPTQVARQVTYPGPDIYSFWVDDTQHMLDPRYERTNRHKDGYTLWVNFSDQWRDAPFHPYRWENRLDCCYESYGYPDYRPATKTEKVIVGTVVAGVGVAVLASAFSGHH